MKSKQGNGKFVNPSGREEAHILNAAHSTVYIDINDK